MTHGARLSSHERPLATIGPPQQLDPPPGRAPHPVPPHVPHSDEQQMLFFTIPNSHVGSFSGSVSMTHGAETSSHERPAAVIGPPQQLDPPPGRDPHPVPPHVPHSGEQQMLSFTIPNSQVGSVSGSEHPHENESSIGRD